MINIIGPSHWMTFTLLTLQKYPHHDNVTMCLCPAVCEGAWAEAGDQGQRQTAQILQQHRLVRRGATAGGAALQAHSGNYTRALLHTVFLKLKGILFDRQLVCMGWLVGKSHLSTSEITNGL